MSVKLNKISVKQMGGPNMQDAMIPQDAGMQNMQQPAMGDVQPQMVDQEQQELQQLGQFFSEALQNGQKPEQVVMGLLESQVDQNTIGQALMMIGYQEEDVVTLFEQVQLIANARPADPQQVNSNPQELARNQSLARNKGKEKPVEVEKIEVKEEVVEEAKSGIEIKPENKGKFTRWAKARGMSVKEAYRKVLANKDRYPASVVKMANFARNAAGWKKEEGGEFTPHMMYKGNQAVKAKTYEEHLRLGDAGFVHKEDLKKADDGIETQQSAIDKLGMFGPGGMDPFKNEELAKFLNKNNTKLNITGLPDKSAMGTISDPNPTLIEDDGTTIKGGTNLPYYVNPNFLGQPGKNFSFGNALNSALRVGRNLFGGKDLDGDGLKDGVLRDFKNKTAANKLKKYMDADYTINADFSEENLNNANIALKKFLFENPTADDQYDAVGNIINKGLEDNNIPIDVNSIEDSSQSKIKELLEKSGDQLSDIAKQTLDALKNKVKSDKEELRFGGGLFKAQQSMSDGPLSFQDWFLQDPVNRQGANAPGQYQTYLNEQSNPFAVSEDTDQIDQADEVFGEDGVVVTPSPQIDMSPDNYDKDGDGIPDVIDIDAGDGTGVAGSFQDAFDKVNKPTVDVDFGGVKGALKRAYNSNAVKAFEGISGGLVDLTANIFNPFLEDRENMEKEIATRKQFYADDLFDTKVDPFNSRGTTDINRGSKGSEGDRTTGLYLTQGSNVAKMGKGVNNEGFKALPDYVQHNILSNMAYGGPKGAEAYLARRDAAIKRSMNQEAKQGGETVNVDSAILAKLIAAGADIEML